MELACDIIRRRETQVEPEHIIDKIKDLGMLRYLNLSHERFLRIAKERFLPTFNYIADSLFTDHGKDLGYALMLSYYISSYARDIFAIQTEAETKLITAANKVIIYLQGIKNLGSDFYDTVDYYYSLYKIWNSDDLLRISTLHDRLNDLCREHRITGKIPKRQMIRLYNKMININEKMTIKLLLQNYDIYTDAVVTKMWHDMDVSEDMTHIIVMLAVELSIKLIQKMSSAQDRKDIYYKVDTEKMIRSIRNDRCTPEKINKIVMLLRSKVQKMSNVPIPIPLSVEHLTPQYRKKLLKIFAIMYETVFRKN